MDSNLIKAIWSHNLSIFITKKYNKTNTASDKDRECFCTNGERDEFMEIHEQKFAGSNENYGIKQH